jgi:hypothetical protein
MKKKIVFKPVQLSKPNEKSISKIVKIPVGVVNKKKTKTNLPLKGKNETMKQRLAKLKTIGGKGKGKGKKTKKY